MNICKRQPYYNPERSKLPVLEEEERKGEVRSSEDEFFF
jgi:hypothetical protein